MKPTGSDRDFELWLERELRLHAASAQQHRPRVTQPAYRAASRSGGKSLATKSGILAAVTSRGAVGLAAAALAIGGGGIVAAAATGSLSPGASGIAHECQENRPAVDNHAASAARENRGIGKCVSRQVNHHQNGAAQQQAHQNSDTGSASGQSSSPGKHPDHGQATGVDSFGAPPGQGGLERGRGTGNSGDHGHPPTPSPHP
jgi:hypothetical protein